MTRRSLRAVVPALVLATAAAMTAGCGGRGGAEADAQSGVGSAPTASASANSGLGGGASSPSLSPLPSPSRTASRPVPRTEDPTTPATGSDDDSRMPVPWDQAVEKCPHPGQKIEIRKVYEADVTGDGLAESIVLRGCEASTSYWPSTVEVFDGAAPEYEPKRLGVLLKDNKDYPWVTKVLVMKGIIVLHAYGLSKGAPTACADLNLTYRFQYTGGKFQQIWRDWGKADDCLPVG